MHTKKIIFIIVVAFGLFTHGIAQTKPKSQVKQNTQPKSTSKKTPADKTEPS